MSGQVARTLTYRRAEWLAAKPAGMTLEKCIREALGNLPTVEKTRVNKDGGSTSEVRHRDLKKGAPAFIHIAGYTPNDRASIVPHAEAVPQADLETMRPPHGAEFMDGDIMLCVTGDHVVLCPSGLREGMTAQYLRLLFEHAHLDSKSREFELMPIADINKVKLIQTEGIRKVVLDASLYQESIRELKRGRVEHSIKAGLLSTLFDLIGKDPKLRDLEAAENLQAKLVISFDARRKDADLSHERLDSIGAELVRSEVPGVTIETMKGERIRSEEIILRKPVSFEPFGKTISHVDAWKEMAGYLHELANNGAVDF